MGGCGFPNQIDVVSPNYLDTVCDSLSWLLCGHHASLSRFMECLFTSLCAWDTHQGVRGSGGWLSVLFWEHVCQQEEECELSHIAVWSTLQKAEAGGFPSCGPGAGVLGAWLALGEAYGSCAHGNPGLVGHIYLLFTTLYLEIISVSEKLQDKNRTQEACFTRLPMCCISCSHSVSTPGFSEPLEGDWHTA